MASHNLASAPPGSRVECGASDTTVEVHDLGAVLYTDAWSLQRELAGRIAAGEAAETLLLLEHPHTYTIGRRGGRDHLLATPDELVSCGATVIETDRGGDITYHGPGQLVGYPLLNIRRMGGDVHRYLRTLEETLIAVLAGYGLQGERESEYTGVWCRGAKVAAIGVKISRGITMHGFALNVNTDLSYFGLIVPCGIHGRQVTSLETLLGERVSMAEVIQSVERNFEEVFGVRLRRTAHPPDISV